MKVAVTVLASNHHRILALKQPKPFSIRSQMVLSSVLRISFYTRFGYRFIIQYARNVELPFWRMLRFRRTNVILACYNALGLSIRSDGRCLVLSHCWHWQFNLSFKMGGQIYYDQVANNVLTYLVSLKMIPKEFPVHEYYQADQ